MGLQHQPIALLLSVVETTLANRESVLADSQREGSGRPGVCHTRPGTVTAGAGEWLVLRGDRSQLCDLLVLVARHDVPAGVAWNPSSLVIGLAHCEVVELAPIAVEIFHIRYDERRPDSGEPSREPGPKFAVHGPSNALLAAGTPEQLREVAEFVARIDVPPARVRR